MARLRKLTFGDVAIFNGKLVTILILNDLLKNIVIVQCNKIGHLISYLQIEGFAWSVGYNIIIFLAQHSQTKREGEKNILHMDLSSIQDRDHRAIGPSLLYYYKGMPVALLTNICTVLDMVHGA